MSLTIGIPAKDQTAGSELASSAPAFELKAAGFTLPVIRLLRLDMDAVEAQLMPKVQQAPGFFQHTPVVIELNALPSEDEEVGFPQLVGLLRGLGMIPVGVRGGGAAQHEAAKAMELAILSDAAKPNAKPEVVDDLALELPVTGQSAKPQIGVETGSHLVDRPVRSGQRVYAAGGDLTVLAAVNSGAELMADGNIHVYAPMRGRAIAGLHGDRKARIFCSDLQAELVSVAGHYRVSDSIPAKLKGCQTQVFLDHDVLRIEPL
ncbi:septum site-determining protein MinC [Lamprobacter modestohalophilus]|uniref:Probable septum site-determining protein MinC n=1 Tax=Lamprobacter modestohalophilus TaxID=1064514 RepID=A0A9X1B2Y2_9GAMM|nr:septum site-determining protein MinC [Lamprobacter modestohalophilus]MCF7979801.1 septum site-determining protein MinC [Chromatiaceae bacterium]MBK1617878.1 septum site-determining protein MinC [Lamprobacter modestohalophilus]MCF7994846.1 septum site-determining protein MinC [Chromatiaceae bacterium]MCF8017625.1 septum site-determining protein MinC [Chromatiaceae bacterium]MEA1049772.1 septum site-determining protein MinC [Lamprobacter modestohalophilus]